MQSPHSITINSSRYIIFIDQSSFYRATMVSTLPSYRSLYFHALAFAIVYCASSTSAFAPSITRAVSPLKTLHAPSCNNLSQLHLASSPDDNNLSGVIDLTDDDDDDISPTASKSIDDKNSNTVAAPFLSQGELSDDPNLLSPDFKDPKQTRVIIYIILTLVPILFLVPLMIGSRDLIPLDSFPPVEIN